MKEILKNGYGYFETIKIRQNTPILEHLKEYEKYRFVLKQVNHEQFIDLKQATTYKEIDCKPLAAYAPLKGEHFRTSGGLKVSDPTKNIKGTFIIEEKRIIYDAMQPFYEERDAYVYSGISYYTEMDLVSILKEELNRKRKLLIYMGQEKEKVHYKDLFEEVDKEEFLMYATTPEKGEFALSRRRYY